MKKIKTSAINKKLKLLRKDMGIIRKICATKKGTAAFKKDFDSARNEMDQRFRRMAVEIVKNSHDIRELKELKPTLAEVRENFWMILDRIDFISRKISADQKREISA